MSDRGTGCRTDLLFSIALSRNEPYGTGRRPWDLAVDGLKAIGGGAAKMGAGAVDALKSVGDGKLGEGAKAIGQGATQVGGAAVEGVKKVGTALSGLVGGTETNAPATNK